jgi:type II secretory pathway pseudopilin PulG
MHPKSIRGYTLAELAAVLCILGLMFAMSVPAISEILAEESLGAASREVAGILSSARARAVFQGAEVGVKWVANAGDLVLSVYQDGNGDGVTTADIKKGVDKLVAGPYWLGSRYPGVTFSFVPGMNGADPGDEPIGDLSDPIRFGKSNICSFSPVGHASPGTVYLSNRKSRQAAVRVSPATAKVQIWTWHGKKLKWIARW